MYLADLNKEFFDLDLEFNVNNWADLQTEEVSHCSTYTRPSQLISLLLTHHGFFLFKFLNKLSKLNRYKQENIFEFLKTEINYVKILNITQKVSSKSCQTD